MLTKHSAKNTKFTHLDSHRLLLTTRLTRSCLTGYEDQICSDRIQQSLSVVYSMRSVDQMAAEHTETEAFRYIHNP